AGNRVDRQQQPEREYPAVGNGGPHIAAGFAGIVLEGEQPAEIPAVRREQADDADQDRAAEDPPSRESGGLGGEVYAPVVDERVAAGDDDQEDRLGGQVVLDTQRRAEGADEERPGSDIDGAEHRDEAEKVEPRSHPAGAAISQDRAPVIEAAGGREGRA